MFLFLEFLALFHKLHSLTFVLFTKCNVFTGLGTIYLVIAVQMIKNDFLRKCIT